MAGGSAVAGHIPITSGRGVSVNRTAEPDYSGAVGYADGVLRISVQAAARQSAVFLDVPVVKHVAVKPEVHGH